MGVDLSDYVSLINAPTEDKPYGRSYTVQYLGNVKEGSAVRYLNLPIEELKKAAIAQMKDGQPSGSAATWASTPSGIPASWISTSVVWKICWIPGSP